MHVTKHHTLKRKKKEADPVPTIQTSQAQTAHDLYVRQTVRTARELAAVAMSFADAVEAGETPVGDLARLALLADVTKSKLTSVMTVRRLIDHRHDGDDAPLPASFVTDVILDNGDTVTGLPVQFSSPVGAVAT